MNAKQDTQKLKKFSEKLTKKNSKLEKEIKELNKENKKLIIKVQNLEAKKEELEIKCESLKDELKPKADNSLDNSSNLLEQIIEELNTLCICPKSNQKLNSPMIFPSGITVSQSVVEKYIAKKKKDPYDSNLKVKDKISNDFAACVMKIIEKYEEML